MSTPPTLTDSSISGCNVWQKEHALQWYTITFRFQIWNNYRNFMVSKIFPTFCAGFKPLPIVVFQASAMWCGKKYSNAGTWVPKKLSFEVLHKINDSFCEL